MSAGVRRSGWCARRFSRTSSAPAVRGEEEEQEKEKEEKEEEEEREREKEEQE